MGKKLIKSVISTPFFLLEASFVHSTSCFLSSCQGPDLLPSPHHIPPPSFFLLPSSFSSVLHAFLQKWAGLDVSVFNLLFFSFYLGRIQSCGSYSKVFQIFNLWFEHLSLLLSTPTFPTAC